MPTPKRLLKLKPPPKLRKYVKRRNQRGFKLMKNKKKEEAARLSLNAKKQLNLSKSAFKKLKLTPRRKPTLMKNKKRQKKDVSLKSKNVRLRKPHELQNLNVKEQIPPGIKITFSELLF